MKRKYSAMEQLDFSEEVCMERYCLSSFFCDDDSSAISINGISSDDYLVFRLNKHGSIAADWTETWQPATDESMSRLRPAA